MIHVRGFHKAFADHVAVQGVDFDVKPGEILGIIGPNGAGKTTTMRALAGIIPPSQGQLSIAGFDIEREPIRAKSLLAFVPDDPPLFHDMTVEEHLSFYASVYRVAEADDHARRLLDDFELTSKCRTPASDLSRGMRQKLAICCAYLHRPRAVLFDEPLTGLDPKGIRIFKRSLTEQASGGAAILISSHLLAMVEDICTHVLILAGGKQRFCGPIDELRSRFERPDAASKATATLEEIFFEATSDALANSS